MRAVAMRQEGPSQSWGRNNAGLVRGNLEYPTRSGDMGDAMDFEMSLDDWVIEEIFGPLHGHHLCDSSGFYG